MKKIKCAICGFLVATIFSATTFPEDICHCQHSDSPHTHEQHAEPFGGLVTVSGINTTASVLTIELPSALRERFYV